MNTMRYFDDQWGQVGNQLFQLGLLVAIRQRRGHQFYLPHDRASLWQGFDVDVPASGPPWTNLFVEQRGSCNYEPAVFEQPDGTAFEGYFQSYRYLEGCQSEVRRLLQLRFPYRARAEAARYAYRRRYRRPLVSVHVRRGDYLVPHMEPRWGNLVSDGYYQRVTATLGDDVAYLVFSDDLDWCRANLALEPVEFADFDPFTCLGLMARCDVNVIANSSFSWWGAYLNPASDVYAPSPWWQAMEPPNDRQDDILPPEWRTVATFGTTAAPVEMR